MRITRIKLTNYIGFYNGLGINELEIDFTKCMYDTIVIKGDNGSGKSTLLNAISVLPDDNSCFIPNANASKQVDIYDNGTLYYLNFIHDVRSSGTRIPTKAYITKVYTDGASMELNPSGNVTSFRDIIFSEFLLDSSFESLSRLGSEDRGIVDKTPSERKQYVASIISGVEVYNDMYKSISKRSTGLNTLMNRTISKIDSLGDRNEIEPRLKKLDEMINSLMSEKDKLIERLASQKNVVEMLDPNNEIQNRHSEYSRLLNNISGEKNILNKKLKHTLDKFKGEVNTKNVSEIYLNKKSDLIVLDNDINNKRNDISILTNKRESLVLESDKINNKLMSLKADMELENINNLIEEYSNRILEIEEIFKTIGFKDKVTLTKDEYILGINSIKELSEYIFALKTEYYDYLVVEVVNLRINNAKPISVDEYKNTLINLNNKIDTINGSILVAEQNKLLIDKLNQRPSNCNIDNCSFISDSLKIENKDYDKVISDLSKERNSLQEEHSRIQKELDDAYTKNLINLDIDKIERLLTYNNNILRRLPNMENIIDRKLLLENIKIGYHFNEVFEIQKYIEYCDLFNEYINLNNTIKELINKREIYNEREKLIIELSSNLLNIENEMKSIYESTRESNEFIKDTLLVKETIEEQVSILSDFINMYEDYKTINNNINEYNIILNTINNDINKINSSVLKVKEVEEALKNIQNRITPLISERDILYHDLKSLIEYEEDLQILDTEAQRVEVIKRFCSPNKGIQLAYMNIYMGNTLSLTNELLTHVFDGEFSLLPCIVSDKEFRIPIKAEGLNRDDISSLSNSQKSIISMIMSMVLLKQSSTRYNILKLDEIDSSLDEANRVGFASLLDQLKKTLNIEQSIMISHNTELNLANADIIVLKNSDGLKYSGNVIYQY